MTSRVMRAARSPVVETLPFTALPHACRVTLVNELGAVHWKVNVVTPAIADFGPVWVISARPPAPATDWVMALSAPPVASTPIAAATFRPARSCNPTSETVTVYSCGRVGIDRGRSGEVTVGTSPPV